MPLQAEYYLTSVSAVQILLQEYLHSSYHPDCDYVEGEVQERNLGEFDHAAMQMFLSAWFFQHRDQWRLHVLPEMRDPRRRQASADCKRLSCLARRADRAGA
jgi:hypothetical protein